MAKTSTPAAQVSDLLRVPAGPFDLSALDTRATPACDRRRRFAPLRRRAARLVRLRG